MQLQLSIDGFDSGPLFAPPVNHPLVCGLHVANNLMLIPLEENIRKSNNWWPDMWGEQRKLL